MATRPDEEGPLCRECVEPMLPWPGHLYVCWNKECPQAGEPVDPPDDGGSSQGDGYYTSERMASAQRIGQ